MIKVYMKTIVIKVILGLCFTFVSFSIRAQGCSDTGFCTVSSFKPNGIETEKTLKNQFKIGMNYGAADNSIFVLGNYLEYNRKISDKLGIDIKLSSLLQNGNDISAFGFSDIYVNGNYKINTHSGITLGVKIPLTDGNALQEGLPLPMDYQSSLGTFDLLIGFAQEIKKLQLVLALQQPLTQNKNAFLASQYPIDSPLRNIQSTNNFNRGGDALLRLSYPIDLSEKLKFTPSLLSIYHLKEDKFTNLNDIEEIIVGSQGLTLNINAYLDYNLTQKSVLQLSFASPVLVRDARPDGLTRSFVLNLEYSYSF